MVFLFYVLVKMDINSFQIKKIVEIAMNVLVSAEDTLALKYVPITTVDILAAAAVAIILQMEEELAII